MNKTVTILMVVILGIALFVGGLFFGQSRWNASVNNPLGMMGNGMMNGGMMGNGMMNGGVMSGMINGSMMGGMMSNNPAQSGIESLSLEEAETAVTNYLASFNNDALVVGEIMIFDNHAYAEVMDNTTGIGAFEVLVDSITRSVSLEPGPGMMWNVQYNPMRGMMGSMMGNSPATPSSEVTITPAEAITLAQNYLDTNLPGATAATEANTFPGYYTLHILRDGGVVGMLSVNGYSAQVFLHHWHGDFVEMSKEGEG